MTADGKEVIASPGDNVVIGPHTSHRFIAMGTEPLEAIAIHMAATASSSNGSASDAEL
jgi:mannose-6-phosphate isomerase-like protein (cupin superfamily)